MKMNLNYGTIKAIHWNVLELLKGISMGTYFNPNNESFRKDKKSEIYLDDRKIIRRVKYILIKQDCWNS